MEDIIRKISGLLATAESLAEQGNLEAAESYISKAHQLQAKYSIDQAMLRAKGQTALPDIMVKSFGLPGAWGRRKVTLAHRVSEHASCKGYFTTSWSTPKTYLWTAFGYAEDVEWVETLTISLCHQADSLLLQAMKTKNSWEHGKTFGAAWMEGFTDAIAYRLDQSRRRAKNEAVKQEKEERAKAQSEGIDTPETTSVALVLADKLTRVEEEYKAKVRGVRTSRTGSTNSYGGYQAGQSAGQSASLARGSVGKGGPKGSLGR